MAGSFGVIFFPIAFTFFQQLDLLFRQFVFPSVGDSLPNLLDLLAFLQDFRVRVGLHGLADDAVKLLQVHHIIDKLQCFQG